MNNIFIREIDDKILVYKDGVLLIEETSYNRIVLIIDKLKSVIQDVYQLNILNEILSRIQTEIKG